MLGRRHVLAAAAAGLAAPGVVRAQELPGVTATEIRIGNTMPYSGPNSAYGVIGRTEQAYIRMLNEQGGFAGRKINWISYDDGFSPPKTVEQIRRLVEQDRVAFLFNTLGTPTNSAVQRYCNQRKVPQLFVATGADKWGNWQEFPWTMGWQPSYRTEAQIYAKHLLSQGKDFRLAIIFQNDDFGKDYIAGLRDVIGAQRFDATVKTASFEITDPTPDSQILSLQGTGADTLMIALGPKAAAQAIRKTHDIGWNAQRYLTNVSLSVGAVMQPAGVEKGIGIITSGYLKEQGDAAWRDDPGMNEYRAFMKQWMPEGDLQDANTVYGFALGRTLQQLLTQCDGNFSRENVMKQAAGLKTVAIPVLLPGITLDTGPQDYRPIQKMQLQRWDGASWVRFGGLIEGAEV
ncbi:ABC transporter substrate-binding protein [Paracraurococcus ruber]|uniref:Branched-chain amino acid ABC transporter substrate-binding protein n=1 Tax=Paracraurococcus ruber TaxID=77675 RepID=A0ABS1D0Z4_9PROT|nr:ABC transporter substrate-binding protein [Paracraurococcus ruber]MBK1659962.1 branched-chain amino acid ABC transporter substrate-binding protein [Paracraurococcus ruber]TDG28751.1 branched-chain amino acid ABC transporter substrate-binding protein [Paracraurococcus ruber]